MGRSDRIACEFSGEWAHRCLLVAQLDPASQVRGCLEPPSPLRAGDVGKLKPSSPLLAQAEPQLKPSSPLRVRNGCFGVFFGCRGVTGFNGCC